VKRVCRCRSAAWKPGAVVERWGRAFESYGEDPYLAGRVAAAYIRGVQAQGVLAQVKHWVAYNQETHRNTPADDVVIDRRALHEIYMPAFEAAVDLGRASSVMCAYSAIGGDFACANAYTQDTVLKGHWRFGGFITSDWGATHSTDASALAGLDVEMPHGRHFGAALDSAVRAGRVLMSRLDDMVRRVLTQELRFHLLQRWQPGDSAAIVTSAGHADVARRVAEQSTVLLRNRDGLLPLDSGAVRSIAVIGPDAGRDALSGGGRAAVVAPYVVTPLQGITRRAGHAADVRYAEGIPPTNGAPPSPTPPAASGSAATTDSAGIRGAVALAAASDVAIVFASDLEEEGRDLDGIDLPGQEDSLIRAVAAANPRTVVVPNTGSAVAMPWIDSVAAACPTPRSG
jgi:beta-glucosidase